MTAKSGATPKATDALDEPASRIATVMKRFESPGAIAPARRNGTRPSSVTPPWMAAATQRTANVADLHEERADRRRHERRDEREAHGDGHRAEERGRDEREGDRVH